MVSEGDGDDEATVAPDEPSLADLVDDILSPEQPVVEKAVSATKPK